MSSKSLLLFPLELQQQTPIEYCQIYENGAEVECPNPFALQNINEGQLEYNYKNYEYNFYSPNKTSCNSQKDYKDCKLILKLSKDTVDNLAAKNKSLKKYLDDLDKLNSTPRIDDNYPRNRFNNSDNTGSITSVKSGNNENETNSLITIGLPIFGAITLLIFIIFLASKRMNSGVNPSNSSKKKKASQSHQNLSRDLTSAISSSNFKVNNTDLLQVINENLFRIDKTLKGISSRVDSLETEVCALNQKNQVVVSTSKSITLNERSYELNFDTTQLIAKTLSVDLLKEAVATNNYDLIRDFPHFFLSETQESQQGLANGKRFILDGDQSNASSRTQSEFIAINCNEVNFLIPNILPNASNPERTLKRHSDRGNIYRKGQGTNLLKLEQLAVVHRNGDYFDLKSIGRIA